MIQTSSDYKEFGLQDNPFEIFLDWFHQAEKVEKLADAFCLSTTSEAGIPNGRMLLYKGIHKEHFVFYTNYESAKGKELQENPWASMVFFWPNLYKQIRIVGSTEKTARSASEEYFMSRPKNSQISAIVSKQSSSVSSRQEILNKYKSTEHKFETEKIECPQQWGGLMLYPISFEFWLGREDRLHDRFLYKRKKGDVWDITRLWP